jgi:hypothetical protein
MKILIILIQILSLFCCVQCQIENGWKGIKVFERRSDENRVVTEVVQSISFELTNEQALKFSCKNN